MSLGYKVNSIATWLDEWGKINGVDTSYMRGSYAFRMLTDFAASREQALAELRKTSEDDVQRKISEARIEELNFVLNIIESIGPQKWITGANAYEISAPVRARRDKIRIPLIAALSKTR